MLLKRDDQSSSVRVGVAILAFEPACNHIDFLLRLQCRNTGFDAATTFKSRLWRDNSSGPKIYGVHVLAVIKRQEIGRHNTDDRVIVAIQFYLFANNSRIASKARMPKLVAENDNMFGRRRSSSGTNRPTQDRCYAQGVKNPALRDLRLLPSGSPSPVKFMPRCLKAAYCDKEWLCCTQSR